MNEFNWSEYERWNTRLESLNDPEELCEICEDECECEIMTKEDYLAMLADEKCHEM